MLFNTIEFVYLFLPIALALHFLLGRYSPQAAVVATALSSLVFYARWNPPFVILPVTSILLNYLLARAMIHARVPQARWLLAVGIVGNLLLLGYFKYADFLASVFLGHPPQPPNVPLALSFTTFVQIAFLVDVWRRRESVDFARYAMFVAFFPHLIAGPIVRWRELGPQIADRSRYRPSAMNIAMGLTIFCIGLAKKMLVADQLGRYVALVFDAAAAGAPLTAAAAWGGCFAYSAQIYFDFSGYSDMAIGLGLLFNLRLPINFEAPFRSCSVMDFWRRWHVTLSRFLRDFVYFPLGGKHRSLLRRSSVLIVTVIIGGFWHGANWTFLAWGAFQGVLLAINHAWRSLRGRRPSTPAKRFAGWLATFVSFAVGMAFFRAADIGASMHLLQAMAGFGTSLADAPILVTWDRSLITVGLVSEAFVRAWFGSYWTLLGTLWTAGALLVALAVPETVELVAYREGESHAEWRRNPGPLAWRPSAAWAALMLAFFALCFYKFWSFTEFLYYQF